MTTFEARVILGLREDDVIDENGLKSYEDVLLKRMSTSLDKVAQRRCAKELKAVKKLQSWAERGWL